MKMLKLRKLLILGVTLLSAAVLVSACSVGNKTPTDTQALTGAAEYHKISAEEAKAMMDSGEALIVLDVREQSEYDAGHISGAVLLPVGSIAEKAAEALPDLNAKILAYCRSGNRSKTASETLLGLGYTQVYDFGGIIDWPYGVVAN
jgi:phage shock protein E